MRGNPNSKCPKQKRKLPQVSKSPQVNLASAYYTCLSFLSTLHPLPHFRAPLGLNHLLYQVLGHLWVFSCAATSAWNSILLLPLLRPPSLQDLGEGDGTPLQYSCLENPMDRAAWWAAVHVIAKSRTRLSDFTFHFYALEKEMATHSSVLAWRIPGMGEPGGLLSMGSHRVGHD